MEDKGSTLETKARLVVHKSDPKLLVDLFVSVDEMKTLCKLWGSNRVEIVLRMEGIG